MKRKLYIWSIIFSVLFYVPASAMAKQAGILLVPTRIVMQEGDRYITVNVKNRGDATGAYRVELVDMIMPTEGIIHEVEKGETEEFSAKNMLRISPRRMVLQPGESQNVRLMVRKPKDLPDGEYRSHLKVTLVEDNVTASGDPVVADNTVVMIKPRFALIIPVILREGTLQYEVALEKAELVYQNGVPELSLMLSREGNRSSIGDAIVTYKGKDGKEVQLAKHPGIAVYRPTAKRKVTIPLNVPENVSLHEGKLHIAYHAQKAENFRLLAETELTLK